MFDSGSKLPPPGAPPPRSRAIIAAMPGKPPPPGLLRYDVPLTIVRIGGELAFVGGHDEVHALAECDTLPPDVFASHPDIPTFSKRFAHFLPEPHEGWVQAPPPPSQQFESFGFFCCAACSDSP